jgi:hypothetical protein
MMGLAFSRRWTINIVRIGDEIAGMKPNGSSTNVGLAVTDNKAYFVKTALVHAVEMEGVANVPRNVNGHFLILLIIFKCLCRYQRSIFYQVIIYFLYFHTSSET